MGTRQTIAAALALLAVLLTLAGALVAGGRGYLGLLGVILVIGGAGLVVYAVLLFSSRPRKRRRIGRLEYVWGNIFGVILGVACFIHVVQGVGSGTFPRWSRADTATSFSSQPVKFLAKLAASAGLGTGLLWFFLPPLVRGRTDDA